MILHQSGSYPLSARADSEANFTAATLLGFEHGKRLVGRTSSSSCMEILHAWDTRQRFAVENRARPQAIDLVLKRLDGAHLTVRVDYTWRPASGQYLLALADITQRVNAEEPLKRMSTNLPCSTCNWITGFMRFCRPGRK